MPAGPANRGGSAQETRRRSQQHPFVVYIEGPSDNEILRRWAQRLSHSFGRALAARTVILGGRRPARAADHFSQIAASAAEARGVCVLDRDGGAEPAPALGARLGLEYYVWPRRHIESYLLVPDAICRSLRISRSDPRIERTLRQHLPEPTDEVTLQDVNAKRLLATGSPLCTGLGRALQPGRIARAMRASEMHPDVLDLLARLRHGLGVPGASPDHS